MATGTELCRAGRRGTADAAAGLGDWAGAGDPAWSAGGVPSLLGASASAPAIRVLEVRIAKVPHTGHKALLKVVETVRRWEHAILTSFDERITNACVEGTNNQSKLIKRRAFGFRNCANFRSRILHECGGL
jgi:hypothetical protein